MKEITKTLKINFFTHCSSVYQIYGKSESIKTIFEIVIETWDQHDLVWGSELEKQFGSLFDEWLEKSV